MREVKPTIEEPVEDQPQKDGMEGCNRNRQYPKRTRTFTDRLEEAQRMQGEDE